MNEPEILIRADPEACSGEAAELITAVLGEAVAARGHAHWATTGGSTPGPIYRRLAVSPLRDRVPWEAVELWWGDERYVPLDHPLSNFEIAASDLLDEAGLSGTSGTGTGGIDVLSGRSPGALIPAENVHPFQTTDAIGRAAGPEWAAERYVETIRAAGVPTDGGWPVFDLVLLGIGPDGHLLSVFPNSDAFDRDEIALAIPAPTHVEPHVPRVTLNPEVLTVARRIIVVSTGGAKADVLGEILGGEVDVRRLPGQMARRGSATWILDDAAAARLPH